ncbi:hypothetical protein [Paracoccus siganidrum]|uniref:Uncharacterized protein n=1 Tax=Paracoccus siganidrum TaxID=1276757 RepID=A0A419A4H7_9RHOB|nr:hypothetical protein [Paracoccus siganidrum]RJL09438.1 hypothetical protein D3P05_14940 [Paracoccus siganidrum]RMC38994.1 hypothetical protein C9E82_06585 [Paracoccus siganidrum]
MKELLEHIAQQQARAVHLCALIEVLVDISDRMRNEDHDKLLRVALHLGAQIGAALDVVNLPKGGDA